MQKGKISIIVPVYNVDQYLGRCIESILNQTYKDVEIILVDDGSSDNCPLMCDDYAQQDDRVIVIHKTNGGLSDARNTGLRAASGDYVMYVDSDDYIELDACERLVENIKDEIDVVIGVCKEINGLKVTFQRHTNLEAGKVYEAREYVIHSIEKNEWYASAWLNLYRRDFLMEHDLYYKVGYYFEDIEMLPRLFLANPKVIYVDYPFYNYVIRENSIMTSGFSEEKAKMSIDIYKKWFKVLSTVNDTEYQKILYGCLVRYYLATARRMKIKGWKVAEMDFSFALNYALNIREKMKVFLFNYFPNIYVRL